jgi:hypothetical protein
MQNKNRRSDSNQRALWFVCPYVHAATLTLNAVEVNTNNCDSVGRYNRHLCGCCFFFDEPLSEPSCDSAGIRLVIESVSPAPLAGSRSNTYIVCTSRVSVVTSSRLSVAPLVLTCITRNRSSDSSPNLTWPWLLPTKIASCKRIRGEYDSTRASR